MACGGNSKCRVVLDKGVLAKSCVSLRVVIKMQKEAKVYIQQSPVLILILKC